MESFLFYVTNLAFHEGSPVVFGVKSGGETIAVRVTRFFLRIYVEPREGALTSQEAADRFLTARVRPQVKRATTKALPSVRVVRRLRLCGDAMTPEDQGSWMVEVLYEKPYDARLDAKVLETTCRVYHHDLDPVLAFTASTGLRCFHWATAKDPLPARVLKTRCRIEVLVNAASLRLDEDHPSTPPSLRIGSFDLETDGLAYEEGDEIRMVALVIVDPATGHVESRLWTRWPLGPPPLDQGPQYEVVVCPTEAELIQSFCTAVQEAGIIVLTGWNIFRFDMPCLYHRAVRARCVEAFAAMSWLRKTPRPGFREMSSNAFGQNRIFHDDLEGIIVLDGYILARKGFKRPKYTLASFAEWIGRAKGDVTYEDMKEAFGTRDPVALREVADYCVLDADLVPDILNRMEEPSRVFAMTRLASGAPVYTIKRGQSILTWGLIVSACFSRNLVMNAPSGRDKSHTETMEGSDDEDETEGYKGATVIEPRAGYYTGRQPVSVLDFQSLYPSIIIAYNLCVSTLVRVRRSSDAPPTPDEVFPEYSVVELEDGEQAIFRREGRQGIFPSVLKVLLAERRAVKTLMKSMEPSSIAYQQASAKEKALKVAANSMYGFLGARTSRIYARAIAASVTSYGRKSLETVMGVIENLSRTSRLPAGSRVIYGDTDSVMVLFPDTDPQTVTTYSDLIGQEASARFPPPMKLCPETVFTSFLLATKKRYGGRELDTTRNVVKGLATQRRDYPPCAQEAMNAVLNRLMNGGADASERALQDLAEVLERLVSGSMSLDQLSITKEINKTSYVVQPPHMVVADKMERRRPHDPPKPGDRITFVVLAGKGNVSDRAEELEFVRQQSSSNPDLTYYTGLILSQTRDLLRLAGAAAGFDQLAQHYTAEARRIMEKQPRLDGFKGFARGQKRPATAAAAVTKTEAKKKQQGRQTSLDGFFKKSN